MKTSRFEGEGSTATQWRERERERVRTHTNVTRDDDKLFNKTNSNIIIYITKGSHSRYLLPTLSYNSCPQYRLYYTTQDTVDTLHTTQDTVETLHTTQEGATALHFLYAYPSNPTY